MLGLDSRLWRAVLCIPTFLSAVVGSPLALASPPSTINYARNVQPAGEAFFQDSEFNDGSYGRYVTQTFESSNATSTRINMMQPFTACDDGSYIFVTPRGEDVEQPSAAIYDPRYLSHLSETDKS